MRLLHLAGAKQAGKFSTACVKHPEVVHRETISVHVAFIVDVIRRLEDICVYYSIGYSVRTENSHRRDARRKKDLMDRV